MASDITYSSYLDLDRILAAQHPASDAHDEMLFIIVHQASELWLKLCLHELSEARECIREDRCGLVQDAGSGGAGAGAADPELGRAQHNDPA